MTNAQQRALAQQEQQANSAKLNKFSRVFILSLASLLSVATVTLLVADQLFQPNRFVIKQLKIKGQFRHLPPAEIEMLVKGHTLDNFFALNLDQIKATINSHSWVQSSHVRREWPDTLVISIKEHRPVAKWKHDKWVNSQGKVVSLPYQSDQQRYIRFIGNEVDAPMMLHQLVVWKRQLDSSQLKIRQIVLSDSHAWTLTVTDVTNQSEFQLLLGREDVKARLARFQQLFNSRFKYSNEKILRVDARYPDGLAIKTTARQEEKPISNGLGMNAQIRHSFSFNPANSFARTSL